MDPELRQMIERAHGALVERFGVVPEVIARAPGRVNLIGDHTDYNDGYALPMAIDRYIVVGATRSRDGGHRLFSETMGQEAVLRVDDPEQLAPGWGRYASGVLHLASEQLGEIPPFQGAVSTSIPKGAGLSSSAAFAVALVNLAQELTGRTIASVQKAKLCQRAEHEYANVPCGIMDQLAIIQGEAGHASLLDCRTLETRPVPMPSIEVGVLVIDTGVSRELSEGVYADRRRVCEAAASALGVDALRDQTMDRLDGARDRLSEEQYRRARHVVTENERVLGFAEAARGGDWIEAGNLMRQSHVSLRDDFEVTTPELDLLADEAERVGASKGVYGCRMTGGGLGGCVVVLVKAGTESSVSAELGRVFDRAFGRLPTIHRVHPVSG